MRLKDKSKKRSATKSHPRTMKVDTNDNDEVTDDDDVEIKRLSKLLGLDSANKKKTAEKLNKEFEEFEGMESGFGDFLMKLDDIAKAARSTPSVKRRSKVENAQNIEPPNLIELNKPKNKSNDLSEKDLINFEDDEDITDESEREISEEDVADFDEDDEDEDDLAEGAESIENNTVEEEENSSLDNEKDSSLRYTYKPVAGEDIYGRSTITDTSEGQESRKYVPPNKRTNKEILTAIDDNSESVRTIRRLINGQLNRLSDQTKETVIRNIKKIFDTNSVGVCSHILQQCILTACANETQLMSTLIPIYSSVVAVLHFTVGLEVGASIVEGITIKLHNELIRAKSTQTHILDSNAQKGVGGGGSGEMNQHALIGSKLASNAMLLLVYLYNLRALHHTLIMDLITSLIVPVPTAAAATTSAKELATLGDMEAEILVNVIDHCGPQLRADDPARLRNVITEISKLSKRIEQLDDNSAVSTRVKFMLEALSDLKNNKSRRTQSVHADSVKKLRKWLGSIKSSLGCRSGDLCLRVSLEELLNAEVRGRWWRAGASWEGKQNTLPAGSASTAMASDDRAFEGTNTGKYPPTASGVSDEETQLLAIASKLKMNTSIRRSVFLVVMSSRDVNDAFERLSRLQLKGKQDREIPRVIVECCGQERTYNAFYSELSCILCHENRQFKATYQYVFWDLFKLLDENERESRSSSTGTTLSSMTADRRVMNLARLLVHMICRFHLSLSLLKPLDMSNPSEPMTLFLATFFMALFSFKITDEEFKKVLDRVATSKDFAIIRDNILIFLQRHLTILPNGITVEETSQMRKRRKETIRTMDAMTVLDMVGQKDNNNNDNMDDDYPMEPEVGGTGGRKKKRKRSDDD